VGSSPTRLPLGRARQVRWPGFPGLSIVERAGDLESAARVLRAGDAIAAVYILANFGHDVKADRRTQGRRLL
jgi:hypothetical protein